MSFKYKKQNNPDSLLSPPLLSLRFTYQACSAGGLRGTQPGGVCRKVWDQLRSADIDGVKLKGFLPVIQA
jgi:hypothetical protein